MTNKRTILILAALVIVMLACFGFGKKVLAATYYATGTLTSTNLLSGESETVVSIDSFYTSSTVPAGTSLWVQFSQDGSNWYNASGTLNGTTSIPDGQATTSLSDLNWSGANFYYRIQFNSNEAKDATPVLDEIKVNYTVSQESIGTPLVVDDSGNVGIGTTTPTGIFEVATSTGATVFKVDQAGNITVGTWQGTAISTQYGGTGQDWSSVATGSIPYFSDTGVMSTLAPGTAGYYLKSQGPGQPPVWAAVSGGGGADADWIISGSYMYATSAVSYVGIGTTTPATKLNVLDTGTQLRLSYSATQLSLIHI